MRTSARMTGAVAAAAAVALLMSGCGSGDDGGDDKKEPTAKPEPTSEKTAGGDDSDDEAGGKAELGGVWSASPGGEKLVLTVVGDKASLLRDKKMCSGRVTKTGDASALVLKCPGGIGEERTNGTVDDVSAKTLKVSWNGGDSDTYTRIADAPAQLPKDPGERDKLPDIPDELKDITK